MTTDPSAASAPVAASAAAPDPISSTRTPLSSICSTTRLPSWW